MTAPDFPTPPMDPRRSAAIENMLHSTVLDDADARRDVRTRRRTRGILIASMATACVVIGAGVTFAATHTSTAPAPGGNVAVPTSHPKPTSPGSPQPTGTGSPGIVDPAGTATPVPTPTLDLTNPSTWVITFQGVGPAVIGGDQTDQLQPLHVAFDGQPSPGSNIAICPTIFFRRHASVPNAPALVTRGAPAGGTVDLVAVGDGSIAQTGGDLATLVANSPKTTAGIGVGMTLAQLQTAYPGVQKVGVGYSGTIYGIENDSGEWISFGVPDSGLIVDITVSHDAMPPSEYCA